MTSNPYADDGAAIPGVPHRWTALTIALAAIGFVVFWPLGLAMVAYVLWGEKIAAWARGQNLGGGFSGFGDLRRAADDFGRTFRDGFGAKASGPAGASRRTGNVAFDAWRASEEARMVEERRKLDETTAAFEAHLRAERGAFDESRQREEFERFMTGRGHAT